MAVETIFQLPLVREFILPFLLIFVLLYAILEKTKILGDDSHQLNALISFVIGLIFIGFVYPKMVVENLILFLTVSLVIAFVVLLLWGFIVGEGIKLSSEGKIKWVIGVLVVIAVIIALLVITGTAGGVINALFNQSWSATLWTNIAFLVVVAGALALVLNSSK